MYDLERDSLPRLAIGVIINRAKSTSSYLDNTCAIQLLTEEREVSLQGAFERPRSGSEKQTLAFASRPKGSPGGMKGTTCPAAMLNCHIRSSRWTTVQYFVL